MVSQTLKGFMLGFLTCSSLIIIYTVQDITVRKRHQICNTEHRDTTTGAATVQRDLRKTGQGDIDQRYTNSTNREMAITKLVNNSKILCWVLTSPDNLYVRATHVKKTWARRCDRTLFFSSTTDEKFPCIGLNTTEGRRNLWSKTKRAFKYIYKHHFHDFDWFMKADDDTYVIVENLRHFLSKRNTSNPVYYGHQFRESARARYSEGGYHSGGSGYVLSKEALRRFGENADSCPEYGADEDLKMGACLSKLGVKTMNSSDEEGFITFFCFDIDWVIFGNYPSWYAIRGSHKHQSGIGNFSRHAISFHYIKPHEMYLLDYFIYRFQLKSEYGDNQNYTLEENDWVPRQTTPVTNQPQTNIVSRTKRNSLSTFDMALQYPKEQI